MDDFLITELMKNAGVTSEISTEQRQSFRTEFRLADAAYSNAVLQFNRTHDGYDFAEPAKVPEPQAQTASQVKGTVLAEAVAEFTADAKTEKRWTAKTEGEKQEHIDLLYEILGKDRPVNEIGYNEGRTVQKVLRAYPVNRHKAAETRGKALDQILALTGVRTIHPLTINKYLQTYKSLFNWSKRVGLCTDNPFDGLSLRTSKVNEVEPRIPFSDAALTTIRDALTASDREIPEHHKWGALIALYTGARLNEVAQLHLADIGPVDGVPSFNINADGPVKKLKNKWSKRIVPIHPKLVEYGLLDYIRDVQMERSNTRLLHQLTYTVSDGYGRNLGRWFNEAFLPNIGLKTKQHTFHSLRHSMIERLIAADVQQAHIMAIVGHEPGTTTLKTYNRNGFPMSQLLSALEKVS